MKEADVSKIIVKYEDGTEKELDKGAVVTFRYDEVDEEDKILLEMCKFGQKEFKNLIIGMAMIGTKMGLFDDLEEE